jgi:multimeric flavodoxin WrbA
MMMKVLLLNGSPRKNGCTFTALSEIAKTLQSNEIEAEIFQLGNNPIRGCIECHKCSGLNTRCVFEDDSVNEFLSKAESANGFIVGTPVFFGGPNGQLLAMLDRSFYANRRVFMGKPGAAIASARRSGATASLDTLMKYFTTSAMPLVTAHHWPIIHGNTPDEVKQDFEGLQTMRVLGQNMGWLLKCIEAGKASGIDYPVLKEPPQLTNFIR